MTPDLNTRTSHETQLFVHTVEPSTDRFDPPENEEHMHNKPNGGIWTSTKRSSGTCGWIEWCAAEDYRTDDDLDVFELVPEDDVSLLVVDGPDDLEAIVNQYRRDDVREFRSAHVMAPIDFESIATDYDGIHLTETGQYSTRFASPGLYGWDCECTLWLDWVFESVTKNGSLDDYIDD